MTVSLTTVATGDTNYVSKINGNFSTIESLLNAINELLGGQVLAAVSGGAAYASLFGTTVSVIGAGSYATGTSGASLTVAAGFAWKPTSAIVVRSLTPVSIDFTGQAAATYYLQADAAGMPARSDSATEALYSIVWTGAAFGTITRLAAVVWGAADDIAAQASAALGAGFDTLDARLEAGETMAVLGNLARAWQTGRLSLSVVGAADVVLTAPQANNAVLNFTGALTGNINVVVPIGVNPREWIVTNNTSGAFTLTVKGATGTGIAVAQGGFSNLYQDGTNVLAVSGSGAGFGTVTSVAASVPAFLSVAGSPVTSAGTLAISFSGLALPVANGGTGGTTAGGARTALGLAIGTDVQAFDAELAALAGLTSAADRIPYFTGAGTAGLLTRDTDTTLAANSDTAIATQKAVKAYVDGAITGGAADVMIFKGVIDASANPNYPAADAGNLYKISVAGKIGGASGVNVEVGDTLYCLTDATAAGTQAAVGANWNIAQANVDGAVTGPASAVSARVAIFSGSTGKIIADSGLTLAGTNTGDETATSIAAIGHAASAKPTPVDADEMNLLDSAVSFALKRFTFTNLKAFLKTYFDTLYGPGSQPLIVVPFYPGVPTASALMLLFPAPAGITTLTFAAALAGSSGKALTAATAQTDFDVRKDATTSANGTSVGTMRFAAAGTVPTFIAAAGFTLTGGTNWLTVWAPATPDATLANISASLYATRS